MKLEKALNAKRLSPNEEITVDGVHEYHQDVEGMSTEELLASNEKLQEQIDFLQKEKSLLDGAGMLSNSYEDANVALEEFKKSKSRLSDLVNVNSESLEQLGVSSTTDILESERLMTTDEVKKYNESKQDLKNKVSRVSIKKQKIRQGAERLTEDLSFRASERKSSIRSALKLSDEIGGSTEALKLEHKRLSEALLQRANEYYSTIQERDKEKYEDAQRKGRDGIALLHKEHLVEIASMFGIAAAEKVGRFTKENSKLLKEVVFSRDVMDEMRERESIIEKTKEKKETLEKVRAQHAELALKLKELFGKSLKELPLNIQVIDEKGYQGLHTDEGEIVSYVYNYEGKEQVAENEQKLQVQKEALEKTELQYDSEEKELQSKKQAQKPSFLDFSLKKQYREKEEELKELERQIDLMRQGVEQAQQELAQSEDAVSFTKEPIDITNNLPDVAWDNYLYIHDNAGRGYQGIREKNPIQTVEDFFTFFEKELQDELTELQKGRDVDVFIERCIALQNHYK